MNPFTADGSQSKKRSTKFPNLTLENAKQEIVPCESTAEVSLDFLMP